MNDQPPRAARRRLIDELEALSETLGSEQADAPAAMPPAAADARPLLDLGAIFDDDGLFDDGDAPLLCQIVDDGLVEAVAHPQTRVFEAAVQFGRTEGILPAPEAAHAVRSAIDEALAAREAGEQRVIVFNLSGHGHFDMSAYDAYFAGQLQDYSYPDEAIAEALTHLPRVG